MKATAICGYRRCRRPFEKKRPWQRYCCESHRSQEYKARVRDREAAEAERKALDRVEEAVKRVREEQNGASAGH